MKYRKTLTLLLFIMLVALTTGMFKWFGMYELKVALWRKALATLLMPTALAGLWWILTRRW